MARTVTLLQLRTDIAYQADIVTGTTGRYTTAMLNRFVNQSIQRFRERISNEGIQHYLVSSSGTIAAGASSGVPFATIDMSGFSPNVVRTYGLDVVYQNTTYSLTHRPFTERAIWGGPEVLGMPQSWAHYRTDQVAVMPAPDQAYPYTAWYLPLLADLSADGDTFDGVAGWEDFIVWDVACRVINRDQYANAYGIAVAERDRVWADILRSATKVSAAGGAVVGRDTFGDVSKRFPQRRVIQGGSALPPANSVTNAMLATMPEERLKGRARGGGDGSPQDLTPGQAAGAVAVFSGTIAGLVPSGSPGTQALFLRGDGSWATPSGTSGGGGGGGGPTMLAAGPLSAVQYNGGSGFAGSSGLTFDGTTFTRRGNIDMPTGGLRATVGTGLPTTGFLRFGTQPEDVIVGKSALNPGVDAQLMQWGTDGADVLTHGRNTTVAKNFSRAGQEHRWFVSNVNKGVLDSSQFALPPGVQLGVGGLAATGLDRLGGWTASGYASAATGVKITAPGVGLDIVSLNVASLSAPIFGARPGLVPTSSSAGMFLRDDGTWQTVTGGGGGGGSVPGLPTLSFQYNAGSGIMAGATGVKMTGSGLGIDAVAITVASLSAPIFGARAGLVPSASAAGLFLKDDGTWATPAGGAGGGPTMLAAGASGQLQYNSGSGFGGATGLGVLGGGLGLNAVGITVASLSAPIFSATKAGLVPTATSANLFLRDDGSWAGVPTAVATGLLKTQMANMPPFTFRANPSGVTGAPQDISALAAASMLPLFTASGTSQGLLSAPTGGVTGRFLRDDGSWQSVPTAAATGVGAGPTMLAAGSSGMVQYNSGSGFGGATGVGIIGGGLGLSAYNLTVASLIAPLFSSSKPGLVPTATSAGLFLKDDGTWAAAGGGGGGPTMLAAGASGQVQFNSGSGFGGATGLGVVGGGLGLNAVGITTASLSAPIFGVRAGLVPTSSSAGLFLKDDGSWATPAAGAATGISNAMQLAMPPLTFKGNGTVVSGAPQDLTIPQAASMLPPFFGSGARGIVIGPTGGTSGKFLQDDGTWSTPAGGGGSSGIGNDQLLPMPPFTLKGNALGVSGAAADLTMPQVASLLPLFTASGMGAGLVPEPTGGASGYFLQDDGSFYNIMPSKERLIGNVGSGTTVGSATIDFTTDPYQALSLFGRTQFTLVPPTRHRHTQLRLTVGGSGLTPTFYGTAVKWTGGSGGAPNWSTGSGIVNFANFFYDGTTMWGQRGVGAG